MMSKEYGEMVSEKDPGAAGAGHGKPDNPGGGQGGGLKPKQIEIEVNAKAVLVQERELTGAEIKAAAIAQGVSIQPEFALYVDLANGTSKPVGNDELIRVHPHMSFSAIAQDDNS
jgi:hypothetical protein